MEELARNKKALLNSIRRAFLGRGKKNEVSFYLYYINNRAIRTR